MTYIHGNISRKHVNMSRKHVNMSRKHVNMSRKHVNISRKHVNMSRMHGIMGLLDGLRTDVWYCRNSSEVNTHYTYYKNHLLNTAVYPGFSGTNTTTYTYDGNGNLTDKLDDKGQTISYDYDANNRLTLKQYNSETTSYVYDATGNVLTVTDANGGYDNVYDDLGRLTSVNSRYSNPNKLVSYTYYEDGLRETMDGPEANDTVAYTYDNAKRLETVTRSGSTTPEATYTYNALGQRTNLLLGNGAYTAYEFNHSQRWLTALYNKKANGDVISSFAYTDHDKVGNRLNMTIQPSGESVAYTFDNIYQLKEEKRLDSLSNMLYDILWDYDEVGNRLTQSKITPNLDPETNTTEPTITTISTYAYNNANQMINSTDIAGATTYTYDANGNQTKKTKGNDVWNWTYNYDNMQIAYDDPVNTNDTSYTYDAMGRRIGKTVNSVTERYLYDGANVIADYDGNNVLKATYVTPFLDQNLLVTRYSPLATNYYYMQDGLGSVRNLVSTQNSSLIINNSYDYYAFGETLSETQGVNNRYKYTGREWDSESQTIHHRYRNNDPRIGRFLSADPIEYGGGINLYGYVSQNPTNYIDPFGLAQEVVTEYDPPDIGNLIGQTCKIKDDFQKVTEKRTGHCGGNFRQTSEGKWGGWTVYYKKVPMASGVGPSASAIMVSAFRSREITYEWDLMKYGVSLQRTIKCKCEEDDDSALAKAKRGESPHANIIGVESTHQNTGMCTWKLEEESTDEIRKAAETARKIGQNTTVTGTMKEYETYAQYAIFSRRAMQPKLLEDTPFTEMVPGTMSERTATYLEKPFGQVINGYLNDNKLNGGKRSCDNSVIGAECPAGVE